MDDDIEIDDIAVIKNYGGGVIHEAALLGDCEIVLALCLGAEGADLANQVGEGGAAPLHCACRSRRGEPAVRLLVEELGADVNARDAEGKTPLHWCAAGGLRLGAVVLLGRGADPDARDSGGNTPLHAAARAAQPLIPLLLAYGADPTIKNNAGDIYSDLESPAVATA